MKKKLFKKSVIIPIILIALAILVFNKDKIVDVFTSEITSGNEENLQEVKIAEIKELQQKKDLLAKELKTMSYDEVVSKLGLGVVVYPTPENKAVKVVYWTFEENGYEYYLDTIFFNDRFVNMESRLVDFPPKFKKANIEKFSDIEGKINDITSLSELEEIVGKGVKAMQYYTEDNQAIYAWSYEEGFLVAYTSNEDKILYSRTAKTLEELVVSSTNCH